MKKKYFTPEMEEMEIESPDLLVGSDGCTSYEPSVDPCADETPAPPCPGDQEV